MLEELHVSNIGGIRSASLKFREGLVVITGESGAGKSSLVRALELVSGKRAQSALIRSGAGEAEVQAVLGMDSVPGLSEELQPQEGTMVVNRILARNGRARTYIQNRPAPLNLLTESLNGEMAIQSQFAQLELLEPSKQLDLLDDSGGEAIHETRRTLQKSVSEAIDIERELHHFERKRQEIESLYGDTEDIVRKALSLSIYPGCEEQWEKELSGMTAQLQSARKVRSLVDRLNGGAAEEGLLGELETVFRDLSHMTPQQNRKEIDELCDSVLRGIQTITERTSHIFDQDDLESKENARDALESKLGSIRKMKRRVKVDTAEELLDFATRARDDLKWLQESRVSLQKLQSESARLRREVTGLAKTLRTQRTEAAADFETKINSSMSRMAMEDARFCVSMEPLPKVRHHGADDVSFHLASKDQIRGPVSKVASGGELSRILLSIQVSASDQMLPAVLVFDEVEAGLGGRAAVLAGETLRTLSRRCQVILVTHEASIASLADQHFQVERDGELTKVSEVEGTERVCEIARMLAGDKYAPEAIEHARSLLANASGVTASETL